jgi:hypothetical protein
MLGIVVLPLPGWSAPNNRTCKIIVEPKELHSFELGSLVCCGPPRL